MSVERDLLASEPETAVAAPAPDRSAPLAGGRQPQALTPAAVLALQRSAGNATVARMIAQRHAGVLARDDLDGGVPDPVAGVHDAAAPAAQQGPATLDPVAGTNTGAPVAVGTPVAQPAPKSDDEIRPGDLLLPAGLEGEEAGRLRQIYEKGAKGILEEARRMEQAAGGDPAKLKEIADWSVKTRNALKEEIRNKGATIFKQIAEARNMRKYGNPVGPSAESLRAKGLPDGKIIEGAA